MRTTLTIAATLLVAGCPKHNKTVAPTMSAEEIEIRATERAIAKLYEDFMELCRQEITLGIEQWDLGCLQGGSIGHAIDGFPSNACTEWMWVSRGTLTRERWAQLIVENDRAFAELSQVWESAPAELRRHEAILARGMNPWVIDPTKEWQCPPLPSELSP
jgi:hypothetical protein